MQAQAPALSTGLAVVCPLEVEKTLTRCVLVNVDIKAHLVGENVDEGFKAASELVQGGLSVVEAPIVITLPQFTQSNLNPCGTNSYHFGKVSRWRLKIRVFMPLVGALSITAVRQDKGFFVVLVQPDAVGTSIARSP